MVDRFRQQGRFGVLNGITYRTTDRLDALLVLVTEIDIEQPALFHDEPGAGLDAFAFGLHFERILG